jgi:FkbM family methyltransferase
MDRLRISLFPSDLDREAQRWCSDGGDERFRYDYDLEGNSLVLDVGGYKGQWASDIYARYNCRVLVLEPVKQFADAIEKRFQKNPKIEVVCLALGATSRQEAIALDEDGSSMYRKGSNKVTINVQDAATFFADRKLDRVELMKLNIEGGEYELLPRLVQAGLVKKIRNIQVQFHNIAVDSSARMEQIRRELSATHRPTYQYRFVWENWTRLDAT